MSDEQASIMIGLLTELRDELRLVRDTVVPAKDHVTMMRTLWDTTETFDLAHAMMEDAAFAIQSRRAALMVITGGAVS